MKIPVCLLGCVLLCPVLALAADPFNYNYLELGYQNQSPQNGSTIKGPDLALSYTVYSQLQVVGGYAHLTQPLVTGNNYYFGIRGENTFGTATDFYTDILYLNQHISSQGAGSTDNGYRLALGLRHLFSRWVEFDGSVGHNWLNQSSNDATVGLLFNATSWLAAGVSYSHSSATNNTTSLRVRFYY
ncbi:MAG: hypothetical protein WCC11_10595 [Gammaproteobacteria bacterium]